MVVWFIYSSLIATYCWWKSPHLYWQQWDQLPHFGWWAVIVMMVGIMPLEYFDAHFLTCASTRVWERKVKYILSSVLSHLVAGGNNIKEYVCGGGRLTSVIVWACLLYVLMWMKTASDEVMFCICLPLGSFKIDLGGDTTALVTFSEVSNRSKSRFGAPWGSLGSFWGALGRVLGASKLILSAWWKLFDPSKRSWMDFGRLLGSKLTLKATSKANKNRFEKRIRWHLELKH